MSKIKEGLVGYDHDGWCEIDRAVMTDELTEYEMMNMTLLQARQELQDTIVERYRQYTNAEIKKEYEGVFGHE
ncbi:MAG: hypothetical protein CME84_16145 [Henriciella sp.]|nr:hypothetical protein [Henriciella sp.]|tara:strand:- start:114 stop:332 length:219 start_codon:yes stop_codon:yes gene_type:complete